MRIGGAGPKLLFWGSPFLVAWRVLLTCVVSPAAVVLQSYRNGGLVKLFRAMLVLVATLLLDQITKLFVLASLSPGQSVPVIPGLLYLTLVKNTGTAFGLLSGSSYLLSALAGIFLIGIGYLFWRAEKSSIVNRVACALLAGGAVANLIDRVRLGYVIDFLDIRVWPVFNLADVALCTGALLLVVYMVRSGAGGSS